eukprot:636314-Alexandrium_andersonii.AAC.1
MHEACRLIKGSTVVRGARTTAEKIYWSVFAARASRAQKTTPVFRALDAYPTLRSFFPACALTPPRVEDLHGHIA